MNGFSHKWHYDLVLIVGLFNIIDTLNVVVRIYASYLLNVFSVDSDAMLLVLRKEVMLN